MEWLNRKEYDRGVNVVWREREAIALKDDGERYLGLNHGEAEAYTCSRSKPESHEGDGVAIGGLTQALCKSLRLKKMSISSPYIWIPVAGGIATFTFAGTSYLPNFTLHRLLLVMMLTGLYRLYSLSVSYNIMCTVFSLARPSEFGFCPPRASFLALSCQSVWIARRNMLYDSKL